MITYLLIKNIIDEVYDIEDFLYYIIFLPLTIFLDIILLFTQPIIYLVYRKWIKENE